MSDIFRFKQFSIDQSGCAMKVNTDGVLIGALAEADNPQTILDIGTGTGVVALMLGQRFANANIDAVEIDETAAETARKNFNNSPFKKRLVAYPLDFKVFLDRHSEKKYDLIVSNPPFHIHSLKSKATDKALARHTDELFFEQLVTLVASHLKKQGVCCFVLPLQTAALVTELIKKNRLHLHKKISIYSFKDSVPHREIVVLGKQEKKPTSEDFVIYKEQNEYSNAYREVLKDFLTIF